MLVELDRDSGAVRVDDEGFEAVVGAAVGEVPGHPDAVAAVGSGMLDEALGAVRHPLVTLRLEVASADSRLTHRAFVVPDTAALLLGVRPGLHQLMAVPPAYLTAALVRLTRLGPRRVDEPAEASFPAERLGDLVDSDPVRRSAALGELGADFAWRLSLSWADGSQQVTAVDGPAGVQLAEPGTDVLRAVTSTTVYRILSTALPRQALPGW